MPVDIWRISAGFTEVPWQSPNTSLAPPGPTASNDNRSPRQQPKRSRVFLHQTCQHQVIGPVKPRQPMRGVAGGKLVAINADAVAHHPRDDAEPGLDPRPRHVTATESGASKHVGIEFTGGAVWHQHRRAEIRRRSAGSQAPGTASNSSSTKRPRSERKPCGDRVLAATNPADRSGPNGARRTRRAGAAPPDGERRTAPLPTGPKPDRGFVGLVHRAKWTTNHGWQSSAAGKASFERLRPIRGNACSGRH